MKCAGIRILQHAMADLSPTSPYIQSHHIRPKSWESTFAGSTTQRTLWTASAQARHLCKPPPCWISSRSAPGPQLPRFYTKKASLWRPWIALVRNTKASNECMGPSRHVLQMLRPPCHYAESWELEKDPSLGLLAALFWALYCKLEGRPAQGAYKVFANILTASKVPGWRGPGGRGSCL